MPLDSHRKITPELKSALEQSAGLAQQWEQDWLGVEHLFLTVQRQEPEQVEALLRPLGITAEALCGLIEESYSTHPSGRPVPRMVPLSWRLRKVLDSAEAEVKADGRHHTGCEDIVRAICRANGLSVHGRRR
jgi:ATP-dependent Clp protease ATP-binding subunit ClpA